MTVNEFAINFSPTTIFEIVDASYPNNITTEKLPWRKTLFGDYAERDIIYVTAPRKNIIKIRVMEVSNDD